MRTRMWLGIITLLAVPTVGAADEPITKNPIPEPVVKRGIAVEVKDLGRLPDTRGLRPPDQDVSPVSWARVSYVRDLPDGRRFANDFARAAVLDRFEQSAARLCRRRHDISALGQTPHERLHRFRLSP